MRGQVPDDISFKVTLVTQRRLWLPAEFVAVFSPRNDAESRRPPVPKGPSLHKVTLVPLVICFLSLSSPHGRSQVPGRNVDAWSRVPGGTQSLGTSITYSPDSSHMLIGLAESRRTWTAGVEYTHLVHYGDLLRWDYEGSVIPLWEESDPEMIGTSATVAGSTYVTTQAPVRVTFVDRNPVGVASDGSGPTSPIYPLYGRQNTYAAALSPLGTRMTAFPDRKLRPSFAVDLGFVVASRDIPVDDSDQFNYMFAFGPGVELYTSQWSSMRLEYLYRHISNAHQGFVNPGVDQGVLRLTLSHHR
jgi:hypothetical protein